MHAIDDEYIGDQPDATDTVSNVCMCQQILDLCMQYKGAQILPQIYGILSS